MCNLNNDFKTWKRKNKIIKQTFHSKWDPGLYRMDNFRHSSKDLRSTMDTYVHKKGSSDKALNKAFGRICDRTS